MAKSEAGNEDGGRSGDVKPEVSRAWNQSLELTQLMLDRAARLDALEKSTAEVLEAVAGKARPGKPYPCPQCQCTRTPIRDGTHWGRAVGVPGVKHYRRCAECGWSFSTFVPSEGPLKGTEILPA